MTRAEIRKKVTSHKDRIKEIEFEVFIRLQGIEHCKSKIELYNEEIKRLEEQ
jgi:hypothetical protein